MYELIVNIVYKHADKHTSWLTTLLPAYFLKLSNYVAISILQFNQIRWLTAQSCLYLFFIENRRRPACYFVILSFCFHVMISDHRIIIGWVAVTTFLIYVVATKTVRVVVVRFARLSISIWMIAWWLGCTIAARAAKTIFVSTIFTMGVVVVVLFTNWLKVIRV
jgi:hypothetical protein